SLPLHRLSQHRESHQGGHGSDGEIGMTAQGIGAAVRRKEDSRFLTGKGTYTDDINRPGQFYAHILRSPHAHAEIAGIDTSAAKKAAGVIAVFTGADMQVGGLPCGWLITSKDGSPMNEPPHPVLAQGKVRHIGDPVAAVIADTRAQAKDAAELINVDYKPLPAAVSAEDALKPGAPRVHDQAVNNRLVANPMEPRSAIGDFDRGTGEHTLYTSSQNPHVIRLLMGAFVLQLP